MIEAERLMARNGETVLEVRDLRTWFHTRHGVAKAVDGVDLRVDKGEVLCIVGESGCGKSVTALSIMRLIAPPGRIETGEMLFGGRNLLELSAAEMVSLRGEHLSMIFQDPTSSLNPVVQVGLQISEVYEIHRDMTRKVGEAKAVEMLEKVGIPDPGSRARAYPHEMSGGMAQRVMIAMALACEPKLLIADEPTTALDVTIQAQILDLMRGLQRETGTATVLITHDLGVVAEMADRVAVMYAGEIVEETDVRTLFEEPKHPYTKDLLGSIPVLGHRQGALAVIPGTVPNLIDLPSGCRFASRCRARVEHALTICTEQQPDLRTVEPGHAVRCWLHRGEESPGGKP
jgi:oligopeptide/dipeptide ABC transporter ATP-binding protein